MQAIETRYLGPTNSKGSRVKAMCEARPRGVTVFWEYGAGNDSGVGDVQANHDRAARAMIECMEWWGYWIGGALPGGEGYAYVCLSRMDSQGHIQSPRAGSHPGIMYGFSVRPTEGGES